MAYRVKVRLGCSACEHDLPRATPAVRVLAAFELTEKSGQPPATMSTLAGVRNLCVVVTAGRSGDCDGAAEVVGESGVNP